MPFCRHRCGYCNFTLVAGRDDLLTAYLDAIEREMAALGAPRPVTTLFVGGGTPSHLPPPVLDRLLGLVRTWFPPRPGYEFSVEANPIDVDPSRVAVLVEHGVNRVSLGAQSFDAAKLRLLERDHAAADIARAVDRLRPRIPAVSLDLIFGVPGETLAVWQTDLEAALRLAPQHVSTYGLTIEKGTSFWSRRRRGELAVLEEETELALYAAAIEQLTSAGFEHYEVSNFARPGFRCRHNETYWAAGEYYAVGPGAARYVRGRRETNHRSTTTYLRRVLSGQSPTAQSETLTPEDRAREALVLGLRRMSGVGREEFAAGTGWDLEALAGDVLRRYAALGLLIDDGRRVRLSRQGLYVSDALWPALLQNT